MGAGHMSLSPAELPRPSQTAPAGEQPLMHQTITRVGQMRWSSLLARQGARENFRKAKFPHSATARSQALNSKEDPMNGARSPHL